MVFQIIVLWGILFVSNQNSANVWFLAGTSGGYEERICSITEGIAILISPIEVICTLAEYPELKMEDDLVIVLNLTKMQ